MLQSVKSVRHWSQSGATRVAVELSGEVQWRAERISGPDRVFFDLNEARMDLGVKGVFSLAVGDALIRQVRVAQTQPRVARVVLDLVTADIDYEVTALSNPWRLVIEVRPKGAPAKPAEPQPVSSTKPQPAPSEPKPLPPVPQEVKAASAELAPAPAEPAAVAQGGVPEGRLLESPPKPAQTTTSDGRRSLTRALGLKLGKIVIDPGHGGQDHGTTGPTGLTEKELVLDVAERVGALVEQRLGSIVIYTRTQDVFLPLEERTALANQHRADLFISIHANSSPLRTAAGPEVFYLNFTTSRDALEVAARENAGHGKSIFELRELIQKIALKDKLDESREFATRMQQSLHRSWARTTPNARNRGVKQAPFVVLIGASMPSILAEIGFLSNPKEESQFRKPEYRQRVAEAIYQGIARYAESLSRMAIASPGQGTGSGSGLSPE